MTKTNLIKATKDSFSQYKDGLITRAELDDQIKRLGLKWDSQLIIVKYFDKLCKDIEKL